MKKIYLTLLLAALLAGLSAQTGLFELSYGDTKEAALANLEDKGFSVVRDSLETVVVSDGGDLVESIELSFSGEDDTLNGWTVYYIPQDDDDIEEMVVDFIISWHGDDYEYDPDWEMYIWELDEDHSVSAYYDWDYYYFIADY